MLRRMRVHALVLLLAVVLPAAAAAQEASTPPTPVDSLARVRVTQHDAIPRRVTGSLLAADPQSVTLAPAGGIDRMVVALPQVARMEVSLGRRTTGEGARRGAVRGFVGGAAVSAVLLGLGAAASTDCGDCYIPPVVLAAFVSIPLTATTTLGGAIVGAAWPGERWARIQTPVVLHTPKP